MVKHRIDIAFGALHDNVGTVKALAVCAREQPRQPPPVEQSSASVVGNFSAVQNCRAALSVFYQRDVSIVRGAMVDGFAQVKYSRPTDGRQLSYRCKLRGSTVLTWDDSIAGARWYGEPADGWEVRYSTTADMLHIQTLAAGKLDREARFSRADLGPQ
jgi:hypothetical protein